MVLEKSLKQLVTSIIDTKNQLKHGLESCSLSAEEFFQITWNI